MVSILQIILMLLSVAKVFVIAHFLMSWLISFEVLNLRQPLVAQIWYGLNRLLEPLYGPVRRFMPQMGGIDLSPLVALLAIQALQIIAGNALISVS